ncbi:MAG TPA: hypothetical protein VFB72_19420 [Verrucomicrobiae bacterium]|nr:hypothetical protein [Verrucomicrobiae bacterium]
MPCGLFFCVMISCALVCAQAASQSRTSDSYPSDYFHPGTLAYHLSTNALGFARGHAAGSDDMRMFSNWHYAEYTRTNLALLTNAVWSTRFWLHGVRGLSAISLGYSNGMGGQSLVTMVSPRHYLFAAHQHPEGFLVAFLDTNNIIYWRKTLQRLDLGNDTAVGILNADLPPSVGFMPVVPADLTSYLPANRATFVQGIGMNQDMVMFGQPMSFGYPPYVAWDRTRPVPFGLGTNWNVALRGGDSSNPAMLLIGDQLVMVSHNFAISAGPDYALQIEGINRAMHTLSTHNRAGSDYQLTIFSLTNWPKLR